MTVFRRGQCKMERHFIGIDIQERRGCCFAVMNVQGTVLESGWFSNAELEAVNLVNKLRVRSQVDIGIDAPRMPLPAPRTQCWNGKKRQWIEGTRQKGYGRHAEIIIKALGIANPQWTPIVGQEPAWMKLGFKLFALLENIAKTYEVFPSASYALLKGVKDVHISTDFSECKPGPKDMVDAWVAAATVLEFAEGRGTEVGGGDGFGTIILPRRLPESVSKEVLNWGK